MNARSARRPQCTTFSRTLGRLSIGALFAFGLNCRAPEAPPTAPRHAAKAAPGVVLENELLRVNVVPAQGGRITSLVLKQAGREYARTHAGDASWGLAEEGVWQDDPRNGAFAEPVWRVVSSDSSAGTSRLTLLGRGARWRQLTIRKTFTLSPRTAAVAVDYQITNTATTAEVLRPNFTFTQALSRAARSYFPVPGGVQERGLLDSPDVSSFEPAAGWLGAIMGGSDGLVVAGSRDQVRAFHASNGAAGSLDWVARKAALGAGQTIDAHFVLGAFHGLDGINAADAGAAVEAKLVDGKLELGVASFEDTAASVVVRVGDASHQSSPATRIQLRAGEVKTLRVGLPAAPQNAVLRCSLQRDDGKRAPLLVTLPLSVSSPVLADATSAPRAQELTDVPSAGRARPLELDFDRAPPWQRRRWSQAVHEDAPRVLALLPRLAGTAASELEARFELSVHTAYLSATPLTALGDAPRLTKSDLQAAAEAALSQRWDAILLTLPDSWDLLDSAARARLISSVKAGTGLVVVQRGENPKGDLDELLPMDARDSLKPTGLVRHVAANPDLWAALPWTGLPPLLRTAAGQARPGAQVIAQGDGNGLPIAAISERGAARVAQVLTGGWVIPPLGKQRPAHPLEVERTGFDYWEYQYAAMARLLGWAAHRDASVTLLGVRAEPLQLEVSSSIDVEVTAKVTARDAAGVDVGSSSTVLHLHAGKQTIHVDAPGSDRARFYDILINQAGHTLAFGAAAKSLGATRFSSLQVTEPSAAASVPLRARFRVEGPEASGSNVRLLLRDEWGRLLSDVTLPAKAGEQVLPGAPAGVLRLWARLVSSAGQTLDEASFRVRRFRDRPAEEFLTFFWTGLGASASEDLTRQHYAAERDLGARAAWTSEADLSSDRDVLQDLGMSYARKPTGLGATCEPKRRPSSESSGASEPADQQCPLFDDARKSSKLAQAARGAAADPSVFFYSLGDEQRGPGGDACFCPMAEQRFSAWLGHTYAGSLAKLNEAWGTRYGSFREATGMTAAQVLAHQSLGVSFAPWLDHRQFVHDSVAERARALVETIRDVNPSAIVGESGTAELTTQSARDWSVMARAYSGLAAYTGPQNLTQSGANPELVSYRWTGYGKPNPWLRQRIFAALADDTRGIGIFHASMLLNPNLTLSESGRDLRGTLAQLNDGVGQLLATSRAVVDPVAVLDSPCSVLSSHLLGLDAGAKPNQGLAQVTAKGWLALLRSLGVRYRSLPERDLSTQGTAALAGTRVLVLATASCLSDANAALIAQFVHGGGTLISDPQPGLLDEHGRRRASRALAGVFGLPDSVEGLERRAQPSSVLSSASQTLELPLTFVEPVVERGANVRWRLDRASGGPLVLEHRYGQGRALYFTGHLLAAYDALLASADREANRTAAAEVRRLVGGALGSAEARPFASLTQGSAEPSTLPFVQVATKALGETKLVLVVGDDRLVRAGLADRRATLELAEPGYLYDVLTGQALGRTSQIPLELSNDTVRLFAWQPSPAAPWAWAPASPAEQGQRVSLELAFSGAKGPRVVRVDALDPQGRRCDACAGTYVTSGPRLAIDVFFALDDLAGSWTFQARDVATGERRQLGVSLGARSR